MGQGRKALYELLDGKASWPPVVVPFGLDPFGWHGAQESYREICEYAFKHCTLLPKVYPLQSPLFIGGDVELTSKQEILPDRTLIRRHKLSARGKYLETEEARTPDDSSWKTKRRWIEDDADLEFFLSLGSMTPAKPDIGVVREKERQVGEHGLPYVEVGDSFYTVCEMFPTDMFYIKTLTEPETIEQLLSTTAERIIAGIEELCREAGCPFILRLIGAEMSAPPFMSRESFLRFEGKFYRDAAEIARKYGVPSSFHCHGPVRDIMNDVWEMGYSFIEPFEPSPRGNVTIAEALAAARKRGIVFGGIDDVVFTMGSKDDVREAVKTCLDDARGTGASYILSQSATPFYDPLAQSAKENILLFMELGTKG
jgi:hypothetical protein